jgi:hypothetical protein
MTVLLTGATTSLPVLLYKIDFCDFGAQSSQHWLLSAQCSAECNIDRLCRQKFCPFSCFSGGSFL